MQSEQAENEARKLEDLKSQDKGKAKEVIEQKLWEKALVKAEGAKIIDDPKLIKHSIKRLQKQKEKSSKEWFAIHISI